VARGPCAGLLPPPLPGRARLPPQARHGFRCASPVATVHRPVRGEDSGPLSVLGMMTPAAIRKHLVRQPFRPFRIHTSGAESFDVRHPDMCIVTPNLIYVGIPDPDQVGQALEVVDYAILHITSIEPIDERPTKPSERRRRKG